MRQRVPLPLLWLLLLPCLAVAKDIRFCFRNITEKDGFNPSIITCMLQDHRGFVWIGTKEGLICYDGYEMIRHTHEFGNNRTLSEDFVTGMAEDRQGKLWIGTKSTGLNCYDPVRRRFSVVHPAGTDTLLSSRLTRIFTDSRGRVWIGYSGAGWAVFDPVTLRVRNYKASTYFRDGYGIDASNTPTWFAEDPHGTVWICTNFGLHAQDSKGGITSFKDENRHNAAQNDNLFTCAFFADDTTCWLGTWGAGLKKFNTRRGFSQYLYEPVNPVAAIHDIVLHIERKDNGTLWIGSADKGLGTFDIASGRFSFIANDPSDPFSPLPGECNGMLKDKAGAVWAGFYKGLSRCIAESEHYQYVPVRDATPQYRDQISSVAFYKDPGSGPLYMGCIPGKGLYVIDEASGRQEVLTLPGTQGKGAAPFGVYVTDIQPQGPDYLLIASNYGLFHYKVSTQTFTTVQLTNQDSARVYDIARLQKGARGYWADAMGFDNGFYYVDSALRCAVHYNAGASSPVKFGTNDLKVLLPENDTLVWVAERGTGMGMLNPVARTFTPLPNAGPATYGGSMVKDNAGNYWLATYEFGVMKITNKHGQWTCQQYAGQQGLTCLFTNHIAMDKQANIWVATQKGPAVLQKGQNRFRSLGISDGFAQHSFMYQTITEYGGNIYMGLKLEYLKFNADSVLQTRPGPDVYLTSLKMFDKEWSDSVNLDTLHNIILPYNRNFVSAWFVAPEYADAPGIVYSYKMDGVDAGWVDAEHRRFLSYPALLPGSYTLHIRAGTAGARAGREVVLGILVLPPFWKTTWFLMLCGACILLIVVLGFRYRIAQVRQAASVKAGFEKRLAEVEMKALRAQMNPHFLFNCLNSINRYIVINDTVKASGYLTKFSKLIRLILDNSANDTTTLDSEVSLSKLYLEMESMRFEGKFTYDVQVDTRLASDTVIIPSMIIQPYAENAIWHGLLNKGEGHLQLQFNSLSENELEVVIEDNGVGREKAKELNSKNALKSKSYGMQITNDRIGMMNQLFDTGATVTIQDLHDTLGEASGTRVTLHIPYNHKHKNETT